MSSSKIIRLLIINPNSTLSITESFKPVVASLDLPNTSISYWTSPLGSAIINNQADIYESTFLCIKPLLAIAHEYDGFLIACYADHLLTSLLQPYVGPKPVIGIFDTSITTALHLTVPGLKCAILTAGSSYEALLTEGVKHFLGVVHDLSTKSQGVVKSQVIEATRRLVRKGSVGAVCLGGAILLGMEGWVREACVMELGLEKGNDVRVIDQIVAGVMTLNSLARIGF